MGSFALNVAVSYRLGTAKGDRTILSWMNILPDEFFATFGKTINNDLILAHHADLERKRKMKRSPSEPKMRWVDGTPDYSLDIYALRKLFPEALFIHIVRNVRDVVRSMLNFHHVAEIKLVRNEEAAYRYWLRMVRACMQAEEAYGPRVVKRLFYSSLVDDSEAAMRSLMDFVGEPYCARCLEPLKRRINSSNVPPDFVAEDPATDPRVVKEATDLYAELQNTRQPVESSSAIADEMEAAFTRHVDQLATADKQFRKAMRKVNRLEALGNATGNSSESQARED